MNRADEYENASYRKNGQIRSEIAEDVEVLDSPRENAAVVKTLVREDNVNIYGEREDSEDPTVIWFLISDSEAQWIKSDLVKLDQSWAKYEKDLAHHKKKVSTQEKAKKTIRESKEVKMAELEEKYVEHKDEESGMTYWYNKETGESRWTNPFEDVDQSVLRSLTHDEN